MKLTTATLCSIALVAIATAIGAVHFDGNRETRKASPAPAISTAPGAPARQERTPPSEESGHSDERHRQVALEIERALVSADPRQRETALNVLLPQLIGAEPLRVTELVAKQDPGETRDLLRDEVTRQWVGTDRDAALEWLSALPDEAERRASAITAVRTLAARSPERAIEAADRFGVGRDDGSLEHLVQIWATDNPAEAMRWIDKQPSDDPRTAQLRARIERVHAHRRQGDLSQ